MAKRNGKKQSTKEDLRGFVIVTFADDFKQAVGFESLLKANDIPVFIKKHDDPESLAIMVPEDHVDEAHVVIDSQDSYEDFYDTVFEDDDTGYLDDDFDDNF
jgi:hypothetical protein